MNSKPNIYLILLVVFSLCFSNAKSFAQGNLDSPSPKGAVGTALLGAELGLTVPALFGLDDTWSMITFPVVGATGGALMGHYLVDEKADSKAFSIGMLAVGVTLIIPSILITANATTFEVEDSEATLERKVNHYAGTGLLKYYNGQFALGVPNVVVENAWSTSQVSPFLSRPTGTEYTFSLLSGAF